MHNRPRRKSPRLKGYDYSSNGAYFVTIKAHQAVHLFGKIEDGEMKLNEHGDIVFWEWVKSEHLRKEVYLDEFVIMPNHFHGIVIIFHPEGADGSANQIAEGVGATGPSPLRKPQSKLGGGKRSLSSLMAAFKLVSTIKINQLRQTPKMPVWQRSFHDQIIKNEQHLNNVRQYIAHNPANWATDEDNV